METSSPSGFPITIEITPSISECFRKAEISTGWNIDEFDAGKGWLNELKAYTFTSEFIIEGPCAFYGGVYGPNVWTAEGGLCGMGAASYSHSPLPRGMKVGRYCSIGKGLKFLDFAHPSDWLSSSVAFFKPTGAKKLTAIHELCERVISKSSGEFKRLEFDPTLGKSYPKLEHDVWIGENVTLSMGITIGSGSIIAAGSIVTRDVPPYSVVAGVPAMIKRSRFPEPLVSKLLEVEWWKYCFADFEGLDFTQPEIFISELNSKIRAGDIIEWQPRTLRLPWDLLVL